MSTRYRASIGGMSFGGKLPTDMNHSRSTSSNTRQTIIGYNPKHPQRSASTGRESLGAGGLRADLKPVSPFSKPKRKLETKIHVDKKDLAGLINNIFEFLSSHNYEAAISKKGLGSGNRNIFLSMLGFIISFLDRKFAADIMVWNEDEVMKLLKFIGYPFSFPKNFFAAIGAPSNWNQCLHVLSWIVELIKYFEFVKTVKKKEPAEKTDSDLLNDYVQKKFVKGDLMENEGQNELTEKLIKRNQHLQQLCNDYKLKIENIELMMQNTLHDYPDPSALQNKISHLKDEAFNIEQQIARQKNENSDLYESNVNRRRHLENLNTDLDRLKAEKQHLSAMIQNQPLTIEESERLNKEIQKCENNRSKLRQTKQEKMKQRDVLMQSKEELVNELESRAKEFNNTIQSEREIFTKCSGFQIKLNENALMDPRADDQIDSDEQVFIKHLCGISPKEEVRPVLREILDATNERVRNMEEEVTNQKFLCAQLGDQKQELAAKIDEQRFRLKRVTEIHDDRVEALSREHVNFTEKREKIQKEIDKLREKVSEVESENGVLTTRYNTLTSELEQLKQETEANRSDITNMLANDVERALVHKKEIIESLRDIDLKFGKIKESFEDFLNQ